MFKVVLVMLAPVFALSVFAVDTRPSHYGAEIFDLKSGELKFKFDHTSKTEGDLTVEEAKFTNPAGELLVSERAEFKGDQLVSFQQSQKQTGGEGLIKVADGEIHFSYKKDGKEKTDEEKLTSNFVTSPSIIRYMMKNFTALKKGDTLDVRFGVLDRRETVGFSLKKDSETTVNGQKAVVIRMKPSSFIIAALVDPLYFTFNEDGSRTLEMKGRTPTKIKDGSSLKDFDGRWVYKY